MTNLKNLSDQELILNTKNLLKKEEELVVFVIAHLDEIERRRLYADFGYGSLWDYATKELGYSENQAYRRINAMRLSQKIPEIKKGLASGELKLSTVNLASQFLKEAPSCNGLEIIKEIKGLGKEETRKHFKEKKLEMNISNNPSPKKVVVNNLDDETVRLHLTLKKTTALKLKKLQGLMAHKKTKLSTEDLLDQMLDEAIKKAEAEKFAQRQTAKSSAKFSKKTSAKQVTEKKEKVVSPENRSRYIPATIKREVYQNANGKCEGTLPGQVVCSTNKNFNKQISCQEFN